jgi:ribosome-associated toxin RatA of RatAB toxin-antitoxin module
MSIIDQSALLPYSAGQMFALVNDIEAYPEYMDGCIGAEILETTGNQVTARLDLGKVGLRYSFTTRNTLVEPESMTMALVEGPFRHFEATWTFRALNENACKVSLKMEFEFATGLVDAVMKRLFDTTSRNLVNAVCQRAQERYG